MASKYSRYSQRLFRKRVEKLQAKGLIGSVDFKKKPSERLKRRVASYNDVLSGKAKVVKAPSVQKARDIRSGLRLRGRGASVVVVPENKSEKFKVTRDGELTSRRVAYGQVIRKKVTPTSIEALRSRAPEAPSKQKKYYVLTKKRSGIGPKARTRFSSFNELLHYLSAYEVDFDDVEPYIDEEYVERGSDEQERIDAKIHRERHRAIKRRTRNRSKRKRGVRRSRGR